MTEGESKKISKKDLVDQSLHLLHGLTLEEASDKLKKIANKQGFDVVITSEALKSHLERVGSEYVWREQGRIHVSIKAWKEVMKIEENVDPYVTRATFDSIFASEPVRRKRTKSSGAETHKGKEDIRNHRSGGFRD